MSGCVAQLCFCALLQYLRPLRMLMCRLPLITVQSWRDWAASTESMIFSPHTLSHGPSQALQYVLESDRQTDSESHTWYTMVTDNGFYIKQLDSDFELEIINPSHPPVPLCKSYPTTHLLGAVRVYPDGHSPIHPLSWMMKTLFCWFMNLKQVSALMQRQPSNL